jgi:hypothetical protein
LNLFHTTTVNAKEEALVMKMMMRKRFSRTQCTQNVQQITRTTRITDGDARLLFLLRRCVQKNAQIVCLLMKEQTIEEVFPPRIGTQGF